MAEPTSHTWTCPSCGRRVPARVETCHCGMTRAQTALAAASTAAATAPRPRPRLAISRREVLATMPRDVKALVAIAAIVMAAGLGWLVLAPPRPPSAPALLGHVDQRPPPVPTPTPPPRPPFKLPWWK